MATTLPALNNIQEFDYSVNLLQALLWQYNSATHLQSLLQSKQDWYNTNQTDFWENWYNDVFNLATANDFGLAVWAIILGQNIFTNNAPTGIQGWGFGINNFNFGNGNFQSTTGGTYELSAESARLLLQLRYFQLVSSGTVPETNRMLKYLFGTQGVAYLVDNHNMTQTYYFEFIPDSNQQYVLNNFDILPRPAGVSSTIVYV